MEKFNYKNLSAMQGEKITFRADEKKQVELTVNAVNTAKAHGEKQEAFSVLLSGDKETQLPQGTYQVTHKNFGELALFMSPNSETEYEIIVNRELSE